MLASMPNAAGLGVKMLLDLYAWLLLCVWELLGLDVRLLLCVWELLGVWVLGTVCCRLDVTGSGHA